MTWGRGGGGREREREGDRMGDLLYYTTLLLYCYIILRYIILLHRTGTILLCYTGARSGRYVFQVRHPLYAQLSDMRYGARQTQYDLILVPSVIKCYAKSSSSSSSHGPQHPGMPRCQGRARAVSGNKVNKFRLSPSGIPLGPGRPTPAQCLSPVGVIGGGR